jgi:predicted permease
MTWLHDYTELLAALTTPLAMLVLGAQLSALRIREIFSTVSLYRASLLRLLCAPILTVVILCLLRQIGLEISVPLASAMFLSTAVSTAATAPAMAGSCGADGAHAAKLTLGTTMFCALTLPLMAFLFGMVF